MQTSIVCIPLLCLSVTNLPVQQISEDKYVQTGGGVKVGPGKRGEKEGLITVGGKEIHAHLECANHYNLAQTLRIKELCQILLSVSEIHQNNARKAISSHQPLSVTEAVHSHRNIPVFPLPF